MFQTGRMTDIFPSISFPSDYTLPNYLQGLHRRVKSAFLSFQKMPVYPLKAHQIPPLFVEPFIINGFRSINQPWSYYWKSLLHKHNETINVWSHLIGVLFVVFLFTVYNEKLNFLENPHSWPFAVAFCTSVVMFLCSAGAHLLHSKSELVHMTCFLVDFVGVSLHGFGSGFLHIYYSSPQWYYKMIEHHYIFVLLIVSITACFLNCFAQYYFHRPYPPLKRICQFAPCGLLWLYSVTPLIIRLVTWKPPFDTILFYYLAQIVLFLIGGTLFGFDLPQRFCPGLLDFFGQGHHLFHLCIYAIGVLQMISTYRDYEQNQMIIDQRGKPELIFCFGSIVSLILLDVVIVQYFRKKIQKQHIE